MLFSCGDNFDSKSRLWKFLNKSHYDSVTFKLQHSRKIWALTFADWIDNSSSNKTKLSVLIRWDEACAKKSRNGDTLGPVELNVWLEQNNQVGQDDQGDRREQDDQGEVSIIIFGMSESSGFQKYSISWVFQALFLCLCLCRCLCHCLCLCICVFWWFLNSFHHKL